MPRAMQEGLPQYRSALQDWGSKVDLIVSKETARKAPNPRNTLRPADCAGLDVPPKSRNPLWLGCVTKLAVHLALILH